MDSLSDDRLARITDYLAHELSDAEVAEFDRELDDAPEQRRIVQALRRAYSAVPERRVPDLDTMVIARVQAAMSGVGERKVSRTSKSIGSRWRMWSGIVAGMVLLFGGYALWHSDTRAMITGAGGFAFNTPPEYRVYSTAPGQRTTIELDDGTRVTLNVASRLEVFRGFGSINRSVRLIGQAQFEVAHHTNIPFVVMASGTHTTVLGTTFGIRAYDANVQIVVKSGKVAIVPCEGTKEPNCSRSTPPTILNPTEMAEVAPTGVIHTGTRSNVDDALAFVGGRLILEGKPLYTMIDDLNRWYDVNIQLIDASIGQQPLKGELIPGTWRDLAKMLELTLHVRTQQDGRILRIFR